MRPFGLGLRPELSKIEGFSTLADLGDLELWLDPKDLSTVWQDLAGTVPALVGDPVLRIDDKSGNGNAVTKLGGAVTGSLVDSLANGDNMILQPAGLGLNALVQGAILAPYTIFAVVAHTTPLDDYQVLFDSRSALNRNVLQWETSVPAWRHYVGPSPIATIPVTTGEPFDVLAMRIGVGNTSGLWVNGVYQGTAWTDTSVEFADLTLGYDYNFFGGSLLIGGLGDFAVYRNMAAVDMPVASAEIGARWA